MTPIPGCLLIANASLHDPNFARTVVYLVEHHAEGTLGLILNRPLDIPLGDLWGECPPGLFGALAAADGGPVEREKGLLLHREPAIPAAAAMGAGLAIGGDLAALARRWVNGPDRFGPRLFLGHSGWSTGQLVGEIAAGAWTVRPGTPELIFGPTTDLWERLTSGDHPPGLAEPSLN